MLGVLKNDLSVVPEIRVVGDEFGKCAVAPDVSLGHDEDVVSLSERVAEVGDGLQDYFRVLSSRLVGRRAVVVPIREVSERLDRLRERATL